jgi:hypothetical protein
MEPHGFIILTTTCEQARPIEGVFEALKAAGFAPWDGNGRPAFVILSPHAAKHQWFEAGAYAGAGVPLFLFGKGGGFRKKHQETISRFGGWAVHVCTLQELLAVMERRGIRPAGGL